MTTSASTKLFNASKYLLSPRRSNQRRQNAKVPKFLLIVLYNCFAFALLRETTENGERRTISKLLTEHSLVQHRSSSCNATLPYHHERHLCPYCRKFRSHRFLLPKRKRETRSQIFGRRRTRDRSYLHSNTFASFDDRNRFTGMNMILSNHMSLKISNRFN